MASGSAGGDEPKLDGDRLEAAVFASIDPSLRRGMYPLYRCYRGAARVKLPCLNDLLCGRIEKLRLDAPL